MPETTAANTAPDTADMVGMFVILSVQKSTENGWESVTRTLELGVPAGTANAELFEFARERLLDPDLRDGTVLFYSAVPATIRAS